MATVKVILHHHPDFDCGPVPFSGASLQINKYCKGTYEQFEWAGMTNVANNDTTSAVHVPSGMSVRAYKDANQQGESHCFAWDYWDLSADTWSDGSPMENSISSVQVFDNGSCIP